MSFKDLSAKVAAAVKPKPGDTSKNPSKTEATEAAAKQQTPQSKKP